VKILSILQTTLASRIAGNSAIGIRYIRHAYIIFVGGGEGRGGGGGEPAGSSIAVYRTVSLTIPFAIPQQRATPRDCIARSQIFDARDPTGTCTEFSIRNWISNDTTRGKASPHRGRGTCRKPAPITQCNENAAFVTESQIKVPPERPVPARN